MPCPQSNATISGCKFGQYLVDQQPVYDRLILEDIRPEDGWILHVPMGQFESYSGVQHTLDRFNHVWPNVTKVWTPTPAGNCMGTPCDKRENYIGWGASRLTYALEEQSWATPLLCFDQEMHVTHAKEHFRQIIHKILKPASSAVESNYLRKRVADLAGKKWVADANMTDFNFQWVLDPADPTQEIYIDCDQMPTSKLTPQMLQRRVQPLMQLGYFGEQPFKDMPPLIELVTDINTLWDLDHLATSGGVPSVTGNWRFEQWEASNKYWKYHFTGQIGNYVTRVDPFSFRWNFVGVVGGKFRFQIVLPYENIPSSGAGGASGLKDIPNPDYEKAQYRWGIIWHRKAMTCMVADATPVNPEMPFSSRNFAGRWQFVMDNLGADINGQPIENKRRNKGQFIADWKQTMRPELTELCELIFYKAEPSCVIVIPTCNDDPGYPKQHYNSANDQCAPVETTQVFTADVTEGDDNVPAGVYLLLANTIQCNGVTILHPQFSETTVAALVADLNAHLAALGTWTAGAHPNDITLTGAACTVTLPFVD